MTPTLGAMLPTMGVLMRAFHRSVDARTCFRILDLCAWTRQVDRRHISSKALAEG